MRAKTLPGMSVRREFSAKSQAQMTTKAGFMNSEGWSERPTMLSQRREPLFSTPTNEDGEHQHQRDREHDQRRSPRLPWRKERRADHHRERRQEERDVAVDEVEAVIAEALGHRRASGKRQDHAADHQT